jgi:hypothetical protein
MSAKRAFSTMEKIASAKDCAAMDGVHEFPDGVVDHDQPGEQQDGRHPDEHQILSQVKPVSETRRELVDPLKLRAGLPCRPEALLSRRRQRSESTAAAATTGIARTAHIGACEPLPRQRGSPSSLCERCAKAGVVSPIAGAMSHISSANSGVLSH